MEKHIRANKVNSHRSTEKITEKSNLNSQLNKISVKKQRQRVKGRKIYVANPYKKLISSGSFQKVCNKERITYFIVLLVDIILIIYAARKNIVHYVRENGTDIFIGKTRYLLVGRNYITLIITAFFYVYVCWIHRFLFYKKNTKGFLVKMFFFLLILNFLFFFVFTKRIY